MSENDESDELQGADIVRAIAQIRAGVSILLYRIVLDVPPSPSCTDECIYQDNDAKSVDAKDPSPDIQILRVCTVRAVIDLTDDSPSLPSPCATNSSELAPPPTQYIALASEDFEQVLPLLSEHQKDSICDNTAPSTNGNLTTKGTVRKSKCAPHVNALKRDRELTEKRKRVQDKLKRANKSNKAQNSNNVAKKLPMKKNLRSSRENPSSVAHTSLKKIETECEVSQDREINVAAGTKCERKPNSSGIFSSHEKPTHRDSVEEARQFVSSKQSSTFLSQNVSDVPPPIISRRNKNKTSEPTVKFCANAAARKKAGHSLPYIISKPPSVPRRSSQCIETKAASTPVVQKSHDVNLLRKSSTDLSVNQPMTAISSVSKPLQESNIEERFSPLLPVSVRKKKSGDVLAFNSQDTSKLSAETNYVQRSDSDVSDSKLEPPIKQAPSLSVATRIKERANSRPPASIWKDKSMGILPPNSEDANISSTQFKCPAIIEQLSGAKMSIKAAFTTVVQKSDNANLSKKSPSNLSVNQPVTTISSVSKPFQDCNTERRIGPRQSESVQKKKSLNASALNSQDTRNSSAEYDHVPRFDSTVSGIKLEPPNNRANLSSTATRSGERTCSRPSALVQKRKLVGVLPFNPEDANELSRESECLDIIEQRLGANMLIASSGTPAEKVPLSGVKLENEPIAAEVVTRKNHGATLDTLLPTINKSPDVPVVQAENGYCHLSLPFVTATWKTPSTLETVKAGEGRGGIVYGSKIKSRIVLRHEIFPISITAGTLRNASLAESISPVSAPSRTIPFKTIRVKNFEDLNSGSTSNEKPTSWHVLMPQLDTLNYGISSATASCFKENKNSTSPTKVPTTPQCVNGPLTLSVSPLSEEVEATTSEFRVPVTPSRNSVIQSDISLTPLKAPAAPQSVFQPRTSSLPGQLNGTPSSKSYTDHEFDIELMQAGLQNKFETLFADPYFNKNQDVKIGNQRIIESEKKALKIFLDRYRKFCQKHKYPDEKFIVRIHEAIENAMEKIIHAALNFDEISSMLQELPSKKVLAILNSFKVSWTFFVQRTLEKYQTRVQKENCVKTVEASSIRRRTGGPVESKEAFKKIGIDSPANPPSVNQQCPPTTFGELMYSSCPPTYEEAIKNRGSYNTNLPNYNTSIFNSNHSGFTVTSNHTMRNAADNSIGDIGRQSYPPNNLTRIKRQFSSHSIPQQQLTVSPKQGFLQQTGLQSQQVPTTKFQLESTTKLQHQFLFPNASMSRSMLPQLAFDRPPLLQQQTINAGYQNQQWPLPSVQEPRHGAIQYWPNYQLPLNPSSGNSLYPEMVPRYRAHAASGYQQYGEPAAKYSILSSIGSGCMQNTQLRPLHLPSVNTTNYLSNSCQKNYYPESTQKHPTVPENSHLNRKIRQGSSIPTPVIQSKTSINVHINNQSIRNNDSTMQTINALNIVHAPTIQVSKKCSMTKSNGLDIDGTIDEIAGSREKLQEPAVTQSATKNTQDDFPFPAYQNQHSGNRFQSCSRPQPLSVNEVNSSSASPTSGRNTIDDRNPSTIMNRSSSPQMPISVPDVQSSSKTPEIMKINAAPFSPNLQSSNQNHHYENIMENKFKENSSSSATISQGEHFPECDRILRDFFDHVTQDESFSFHD